MSARVATGRVKRGPARQNADPAAMLTGVKAAWKFVRRHGGPAWPERTFHYHVHARHVPAMQIGRQWYFWPAELAQHFRFEWPDTAA